MQNGLVMAGAAGIPRTWETLFSQALKLIGEIANHGRDYPFWTFGGGTVLMLTTPFHVFVSKIRRGSPTVPAGRHLARLNAGRASLAQIASNPAAGR
jgi:hypothetical protein